MKPRPAPHLPVWANVVFNFITYIADPKWTKTVDDETFTVSLESLELAFLIFSYSALSSNTLTLIFSSLQKQWKNVSHLLWLRQMNQPPRWEREQLTQHPSWQKYQKKRLVYSIDG